MKMLLFLLLLGIVGPHCTSARTHSLTFFIIASSGVPNFPEFVVVGLVDDVEITHYDSNTKREEPKQDWVKNITDEFPQFWETNAQFLMGEQQTYKGYIETVKQRLNLTGGVHLYQVRYGCEWDDETGEVKGYEHHGFDGEYFLILDLETESWIATRPEAVLSKQKYEKNKALMAQQKNYFTHLCPEHLKKFVNLGRSSLMRTDKKNTPSPASSAELTPLEVQHESSNPSAE